MDLKEGSTDAQSAQGPLPADLVRSLVRQVLAELARLHQEHEIHGAIRPANLHIDAAGHVQLGGPSPVGDGKEPRGPAKYLAPELLKPEFGPIGPGVDLYCLGFTAMELLKGPAFDALFPGTGPDDIDVEIAWARWHSSPDTLGSARDLVPNLPEDLSSVLDRLLQKKVADRYPSAEVALADLVEETALGGETIRGARPAKNNTVQTERQPPPQAGWQSAAAGAVSTAPDRIKAPPQPAPAPAAAMPVDKPPKRSGSRAKWLLVPLVALALGLAGSFIYWPPASDKVRVTIASVPPRAKVFIDNKAQDQLTNATLDLPPGEYNLRLALDSYEPFEGKIVVSAQRRTHKVTLLSKPTVAIGPKVIPPKTNGSDPGKNTNKRIVRNLTVETSPPAADVYINGKLQEKKSNGTFEVVDEGPITLKLVYQNLPEVTRKIDEPAALDKPIRVTFDRMVRLRTTPPGATLFLDGTALKDKSPVDVALAPGNHRVKAVLPGYVTGDKDLAVMESQDLQENSLVLQALKVERYALLAGVLKGTPDLPAFVHAESDVETMNRVLQIGGFTADKVAVLTQARGKTDPAAAPAADNLLERLRKFAAASTSADVVVVALIGHIVEPPGGGQPHFQADGGTRLAMNDVLEALKNVPAQKKLLILDCWRRDWNPPEQPAGVRTWDPEPPPGVTILYACAKGRAGYEHPSSRHSLFVSFLTRGLLGDAAGPEVSGPALVEYCRREIAKLKTNSYRDMDQAPLLVAPGKEDWAISLPGTKARDYLDGCTFLENKDYAKAVGAFNRAEKLLPGFVEVYLRRAEAYHHQRQFDSAMADCRAALKLEENNATAYSNLAETQVALPVKKDFGEVTKNYTRAIELDPEYALAYNTRGVGYITSADYEPAIKDFTKAIGLQPRVVYPWGNRGAAQLKLKRWDEAIGDLSKAIELDDTEASPFAFRAEAWRAKGNAERAIEDYQEALKRDKKNAAWWNASGSLRFKTNDLDNAIKDFKNATEWKPDSKTYWFNLGFAYRARELYVMAADALEMAVKIDPKYRVAHEELSFVYRKLNRDDKAKLHKKIADDLKK
jgi:tetratricopeptide (TPR) repeat protein